MEQIVAEMKTQIRDAATSNQCVVHHVNKVRTSSLYHVNVVTGIFIVDEMFQTTEQREKRYEERGRDPRSVGDEGKRGDAGCRRRRREIGGTT